MIAKQPPTPTSPVRTPFEAFQPALLTFGPLFMYIGLTGLSDIPRAQNTLYLFDHLFALAGVVGLTIGLSLLFVKQVRIMQRLDALEKQAQAPL